MPARDLRGRPVALHPRGRNARCESPSKRRPMTRRMSRTAAPLGEVTMPIRRGKRGSGTLAALGEEALGAQTRLELLERELERAEPARLQQLDHELVLAALRVDLEAAEREHVLAVARLEADAPHPVAEEHRRGSATSRPSA